MGACRRRVSRRMALRRGRVSIVLGEGSWSVGMGLVGGQKMVGVRVWSSV